MRRENAKSSDATGDTEGPGEDSFFRRGSSRKRRARRGLAVDDTERPPVEESAAAETPAPEEPERVLTDEDMPPLDSLDEDSDFSPFMSPGVSESLRKLALRKMFLSSKYNFTDGLDDYAEDFTKFAPLGNIITADMRHQMEMQAERAKEKLEQEARAALEEAPAGEAADTPLASADAAEDKGGEEKADRIAARDSEGPDPAPDKSAEDESRQS